MTIYEELDNLPMKTAPGVHSLDFLSTEERELLLKNGSLFRIFTNAPAKRVDTPETNTPGHRVLREIFRHVEEQL
jgi:hypothetical protein